MGDKVYLPVDEVTEHGTRLANAAADLRDSHKTIHATVEDLIPGFGEQAAAALETRLSNWKAATKAHHENVVSQADYHHHSVAEFVRLSQNQASGFDRPRP